MGEPGGLLSMGHTELDMTEATQQQQQHVLHACMLSYVQLFATLWTVAHQAPLSMGILQARKLEWVAISFSRGSSRVRDPTCVSCIAGGLLHWILSLLSHQGSRSWLNLDRKTLYSKFFFSFFFPILPSDESFFAFQFPAQIPFEKFQPGLR